MHHERTEPRKPGCSEITDQAPAGAAVEFGWSDSWLSCRCHHHDEGNDGVPNESIVAGPVLAVGFRF